MPIPLILLSLLFLYPSPVRANTDPQVATVSATATIPAAPSTTSDTTAPPAVILVSPHDGAVTNQTRPEFTWEQTFDTNSNTVFYRVKLHGVATFLGVSNTGNSQQSNYIAHIGDGRLYLTPTIDLPEGIYDWSVEAYDGSGNTSYSTTWRLTIDTTPPILTVTNIDDTYLYPSIFDETEFKLPGPQAVTLTFLTESWATVSLTATLPDGNHHSLALPTEESGLVTTTLNLPIGFTTVLASSFDQAGHTTTLPLFYLKLVATPLPGLTISNLPNYIAALPYTGYALITSLPASISQIDAASSMTIYILILLAVIVLILLIILWYKQVNILIIDQSTNKPYRSLKIYHSKPNRSARVHDLMGRLYLTTKRPILYELGHRDHGRLYIRALGRYSSLTLRNSSGTTHILSLAKDQKSYIITI
jgi:hypothetical protein